MDIRTKLVFALVAVALGSMFTLGWVMSTTAEVALRQSRLEQLDGLAQAREEGLEQVFQGWIDRVSLVATRPPLRGALQEYNDDPGPRTVERIRDILADVVRVVDIMEGLAVYDPRGRPVAAAGTGVDGGTPDEGHSPAYPVADGIQYQGVSGNGNGSGVARVRFVADLTGPDGLLTGYLHISLSAQGLLDLTDGDVGMGESGETLVVALDRDGAPRVLHRTGPEGGEAWDPVRADSAADPVRLALAGEEGIHWRGITDDRGVAVWAAVRFLPEPGWGLVLKLDAQEARRPMEAFRDQALRLTLSLGAFAIVLGTLLGFQFSKPILRLVETTEQLRSGDFSARTPVTGENELSLLAQTFNQMAGELEERVGLLAEFQHYFHVSRDMLCIAGPDGYFKRVNPAFRKTLGWTEDQMQSRPFLDFVHPEDKADTLQEMERLARGLPTVSFENRYEMAHGGYRVLQWTAHPDEGTDLIYAIAQDVTEERGERNRAKAEIAGLKARLEAVMKERGDGEGDPS